MKKGLDPWVREHRTSLPSQGRSLVSRIWPCVAHSCWILSSRGTKTSWHLPEEWEKRRFWKHRLNRRARGRGSGCLKGVLPHPQEPRGQLVLEACRPKKGRNASSDLEPPTAVPEQSAQDHRMEDTQRISLTWRLKKLEQRPQRLKKQQGSGSFQNNPEKIVY